MDFLFPVESVRSWVLWRRVMRGSFHCFPPFRMYVIVDVIPRWWAGLSVFCSSVSNISFPLPRITFPSASCLDAFAEHTHFETFFPRVTGAEGEESYETTETLSMYDMDLYGKGFLLKQTYWYHILSFFPLRFRNYSFFSITVVSG